PLWVFSKRHLHTLSSGYDHLIHCLALKFHGETCTANYVGASWACVNSCNSAGKHISDRRVFRVQRVNPSEMGCHGIAGLVPVGVGPYRRLPKHCQVAVGIDKSWGDVLALGIDNLRALGHTDVFPHSLNLAVLDRKSTRLNSSHVKISYAVFCLKKKKT